MWQPVPIIAILVASLAPRAAGAQTVSPLVSAPLRLDDRATPPPWHPGALPADAQHGARLRNTGIVMAVLGGAAGATAGFLAIWMAVDGVSDWIVSYVRPQEHDYQNRAIALAATSVAAGILIPIGIVQLVDGSAELRRARARGLTPVAAQPFVSPVAGGAVAGIRVLSF
jgi:hypothetical protein